MILLSLPKEAEDPNVCQTNDSASFSQQKHRLRSVPRKAKSMLLFALASTIIHVGTGQRKQNQ